MRQCFVADLGGTKLSCALVDASGTIRARKTEAVDLSSTQAPVEQICRMAEVLTSAVGGRGERRRRGRSPARGTRTTWTVVGVAVPGLVRPTGTVWAPNLPGWERLPLARLLARCLRAPVVVESDRSAAVTGEAWRGARGKSDVIALIVGTGIGAGIITGGRLLRGAHELSGSAGWMVVSEEENETFFRVGCLEALAAGPAIARAASEAMETDSGSALSCLPSESIGARQIAEAARAGDRLARRVFERAGRFLGFAVANLISLFDPEVVVLGGGLAGAADLYLDTLRRVALERCQPLAARRVKIRVSRLGNDANLLGMARLAFAKAGVMCLEPGT